MFDWMWRLTSSALSISFSFFFPCYIFSQDILKEERKQTRGIDGKSVLAQFCCEPKCLQKFIKNK